MKKLRAERSQKSYKRIDFYLKQVWKQNKDYLNKNIEDYTGASGTIGNLNKEQLFYKVVKEIWKNKEYDETLGRKIKTYDEAIDKAQRSSLISSKRHYQELVVDKISEDKDGAYQDVRHILGKRKFDPDNISFMGDQQTTEGWESWYRYDYHVYEKYNKIATRGKRKGQVIEARRKVDKTFYIIFHKSFKGGGGGWYEILEEPTEWQLHGLEK